LAWGKRNHKYLVVIKEIDLDMSNLFVYFVMQSAFCLAKQPLETLQDIRKIMEKSSRFISLGGWGVVSAGILD
jgi:hypothetical protein